MAKSKKKQDSKAMGGVEETLTRTEQFIEDNYRSLLYGLAIVVVIVGAVWLVKNHLEKRTEDALSQMYVAENYFAKDSLNLAVYGDGNYLGFLDIANEYKMTKAGNLANYYTGVCFLRMGEFEDAIEFLEKFKKKDKAISPVALGCIGDAFVELNDIENGIQYYMRAVDYSENSFYNPIYLLKAGQLYEMSGNMKKALEMYQTIKEKYPDSNEGNNIEKYIARVKVSE
ncbi:MAG TPA: tetratricopeptide repeat protein [Bacteroidales bacterium]|nr:tetratricopeptide repeat protein [Bacteroidales bacterium]